jgi:hypothetical protein
LGYLLWYFLKIPTDISLNLNFSGLLKLHGLEQHLVKFKMYTKRFGSSVGIQVWEIVKMPLGIEKFVYLYENAPLRENVRLLQSILYSGWLGTA